MKTRFLLFAAITLISIKVKAQNGFSSLIQAGPADATKLFTAYSEPLFKGFGVGLNSGWNNTAKTKKLLHFDIRVTASLAFVPTADKSFDVTKIGLSNNVRPADPNQTITPTFGGDKNTPDAELDIYNNDGRKVSSFNMPAGILSVIPAPQVQLTIGLLQNTDLTLRGIPSINIGSDVGSVSMIGFGLKHDIMQDIAGKTAGELIPFDLAIAFGYSHLSLNVPLTVLPDDGAQPENGQQSTDFRNQHINGSFNSFILQAIISKKLLFFTPFLSVGYNSFHTSAAAIGNYPLTTGSTLAGTPTYTTYTNPVNLSETSLSGLRADIGFQLNLAFFRIYASYSDAQYKSINAGLGFGF